MFNVISGDDAKDSLFFEEEAVIRLLYGESMTIPLCGSREEREDMRAYWIGIAKATERPYHAFGWGVRIGYEESDDQ